MVIIESNTKAFSNLLQVCHDHKLDSGSIASNQSTFEAQPFNKFESSNSHNEKDTLGTSSECNLDLDDDNLSAREGTQVVQETAIAHKLDSFILENTPVTEMIIS